MLAELTGIWTPWPMLWHRRGVSMITGEVLDEADGTLPLNTIAETLGYDVTEAVSGRVVVSATPNGKHLNPAGTVHVHFPRIGYRIEAN